MVRYLLMLAMASMLLFACKSQTPDDPGPQAKGEETAPIEGEPQAREAAPSPLLEGHVGSYVLRLDPDAGWHANGLHLDAVSEAQITGRVVIDWNIGPEAREPGPDEIVHEVAFTATRSADAPYALSFDAEVGTFQPVTYTFALTLCPDSGAESCDGSLEQKHVVGTVTTSRGESMTAKATRVE